MRGFFLYAVFFNGSLAALGTEEDSLARSLSLFLSSLHSAIYLYLLLHPFLANLCAFFFLRESRLLSSARSLVRSCSPSPPLPFACLLGIAVLCSPFPRVSRKAKWSFCSAFTAGARGQEAYNFLGVFIAG